MQLKTKQKQTLRKQQQKQNNMATPLKTTPFLGEFGK